MLISPPTASPSAPTAAALGGGIANMINTEPMVMVRGMPKDGISACDNPYRAGIDRNLGEMRRGALHFSRFESIHRRLCLACRREDPMAVENGPGLFPYNAAAMMELGCRVTIKESDPGLRKKHLQHIAKHYAGEMQGGRIEYMADEEDPVRADISYWASPTPGILRRLGANIALDYLGRDVAAGGFLVVQSDSDSYDRLFMNVGRWELVHSSVLNGNSGTKGLVLTTYFDSLAHSFKVYRRLA
ncbi:MAG: hypothetical protein JXA24_00880 [Proteobacteria bacterium]|nr:hypothetical protein [Pseudomonadota bacterium]